MNEDDQQEKATAGVRTLLGNPRSAILKLSVPMIIAMSVQTVYNLVDAIWVSGLGADALAAIGFVFPFFFMAMGLSNGLGVGGGSAISRRIGAHDKAGADNVAVHTIILMLLTAAAFTLPGFLFADELLILIGAGQTAGMAAAYARIIFLGSILIFFTSVGNAFLRSEGDAKRAMYAMLLSAVLNIILDPIFIYTLDWGVEGAAVATVISMAVASLLILNWLVFRKDTYLSFSFRDFRFRWEIVRDILRTGLPAAVQHLSMAFTMLIMNLIIIMVAGTDGVAIYSVGWRVVTVATMPLVGIATAVVSVCGAAYGAGLLDRANTAQLYATKLGVLIEIPIAGATFILAPWIAAVFTLSEAAAHIAPDLVIFLRIVTFFYPVVAFGMFSSALFQGTGKGMNALIVTVLRTLILTPLFAGLFAFTLGMGLEGVWWGMVTGNLIGSIAAFLWARLYLNGLMEEKGVAA